MSCMFQKVSDYERYTWLAMIRLELINLLLIQMLWLCILNTDELVADILSKCPIHLIAIINKFYEILDLVKIMI